MNTRELSIYSNQPRWLTLSEAAQFLGVHPSTVRRWTDDGDLHCMRTPGGHRRFLQDDLQAFLASREHDSAVASPDALADTLIRHTRHEMTAENVDKKPWIAAFDVSERAMRRESGRRLLGLAIRYTSRNTGRETVLKEGRDIGWDYGQDAATRGLSLADTAQAFLFFRETLVRAARPGPAGIYDVEDAHIRRSLQEFLDAVFCAAMDAYERTLRDQVTSGSSH